MIDNYHEMLYLKIMQLYHGDNLHDRQLSWNAISENYAVVSWRQSA